MDTKSQKPSFIVDSHGHARDVRHLDESQISAVLNSANTVDARTQNDNYGAPVQQTSRQPEYRYYVIFIPVGLLVSLLIAIMSNTGHQRADRAFSQGVELFRSGDYDQAITKYDEAIRLNSNLCEAYDHRGLAYQAKGELETAVEDYDQAIACHAKVKRDTECL